MEQREGPPADDVADLGDLGEEAGLDRILTIPNLLTLVRLLCVPVFLWLLFGRDDRAAAAFLLAGLGATDWVDGYVARHFNQVSDFGKLFDPTADRVLLIVAIGGILVDGSVPTWVAIVVLVREVLVAIVAVGISMFGATRIDVTWVGKAGTFCNMFAFPMFLGGESNLSAADALHVGAWLFVLPGIVLSYYAAAGYVPLAAQAVREGRASRAAGDLAAAIDDRDSGAPRA